MFNSPDHFCPAAAEPWAASLSTGPGATDEDPDFIAASLRAIYYEVSVAKQHTLVMTFLGKLGMLPRIAPFNAAIALITDPHATFLADLGTWWTWKRRPAPGTTPIPIQKALGPVSFVWDIRHTLPMTGDDHPTPALEAPEEHHVIVTEYPADRYRCARAVATHLKSQCKPPRGANVENSTLERWDKESRGVLALLQDDHLTAKETFDAVVRRSAGFVLGHRGPTPTHPISRQNLSPETHAFETAAVTWILHQVLTNDDAHPDELALYTSGCTKIPDGVHLTRLISTASKFYGAMRDVLPRPWNPAERH